MKTKFQLFNIFFILILSSCGTSFGKKIEFGNLEIFYSESVSKTYVQSLGDYFVTNNLVLNEKHSIKLTSDHQSFILKLIINDKYNVFPKDMENELAALESDIQNTIFKDLKFKIEVCDVNFYPLNLKH